MIGIIDAFVTIAWSIVIVLPLVFLLTRGRLGSKPNPVAATTD